VTLAAVAVDALLPRRRLDQSAAIPGMRLSGHYPWLSRDMLRVSKRSSQARRFARPWR
jgi:hypothetical protein